MAQHQLGQQHAAHGPGLARLPAHGDGAGQVVQGRCRLARHGFVLAVRSLVSQRLHLVCQRLQTCAHLGVPGGVGQLAVHMLAPDGQGVFAHDGAHHVQRHDVAGAFPDRAQVRVAHDARVAPLFDVTAAATHFHGITGDLARIAAGAELDQRREQAGQCVGAFFAGIAAAQGLCRLEHHGARLLGGHHQLGQLALHQRHVDQVLAERLPMPRDVKRFGQGAAHQAGGAHAIGQAGVVDHVRHLRKAAAELAHQPGLGAFQTDFAAGHRSRAHLVLEADDAVAVGAAVGQGAWQQEKRNAFHAGRSAFGAGQHHGQCSIGVGAEPFVAVQPPRLLGGARLAVVRAGQGDRGRDVRACALLGHEHGALRQRVQVLGGQVGQVALHQFRPTVLAQGAGERIGHRQRAAQSELGLHKQVGQRVFDGGRHGLVPAQHTGAVRHGRQAELAECQPLHFHIVRVFEDALGIDAGARAVLQRGRVQVCAVRQPVQFTASQLAQPVQVGLQMGHQFGRQVQRQQAREFGVVGVGVGAGAVGHRVLVSGGAKVGGQAGVHRKVLRGRKKVRNKGRKRSE